MWHRGVRPRIRMTTGLFAGVVLAIILVVFAIYLAFLSPAAAMRRADSAARSFMDRVTDGRLDQAYQLTSQDYRRLHARDQFDRFWSRYRQLRGVEEIIQLRESVSIDPDAARCTLTYEVRGPVQFERVEMVMVSAGGPFEVEALRYIVSP